MLPAHVTWLPQVAVAILAQAILAQGAGLKAAGGEDPPEAKEA